MNRLADALDTINRNVGYVVRWLALLMVLAQFGIVLLRYVFGVSWVWANESVLYMHAAFFMIAAGYTLLVDEHVRVDIWYAKEGPRGKALTNLLGHLVLLIPSMTVLLLYSWPSVRNSWKILEGPISVGGIPASFLLKTLIPIFCVLLIIQAVANILRDLARLAGTR
ncbi:TRAP transporter small permease subunit [Roseovarius sp. ZX-A-9]|uniref:TRAP transporter small permease subunit n=1 Tax=Roseovarius sp. ZX-A-9 TaxID=3014783 RepID=UPI0023312859|nr:TRAP transporter small permease subunit [Roseovarius sp. ZX-A-9]